jgi:hypothetical protein
MIISSHLDQKTHLKFKILSKFMQFHKVNFSLRFSRSFVGFKCLKTPETNKVQLTENHSFRRRISKESWLKTKETKKLQRSLVYIFLREKMVEL